MEWFIYLIYCLGFLPTTDVGHFVSNTPIRDDGFLSVNLGMLGQRSVGQLWTRSIDQVGLRGSGSDTMFVNMRSQCPSSYAREVPKTILILVWIGLPLENWCMCVHCLNKVLGAHDKSLVVDQTLWWWQDVRRKGETKNQPHWDFQAVLSVKQGRQWCLLAIEVRLWSRVYESLNLIIRLINPLANP